MENTNRPLVSFSQLLDDLLLHEILPRIPNVTSRAQWRQTEKYVARLFPAPLMSFNWWKNDKRTVENLLPTEDSIMEIDNVITSTFPSFTWSALLQAVYDDHMGLLLNKWPVFLKLFDPEAMTKQAHYTRHEGYTPCYQQKCRLLKTSILTLLKIASFGNARFAWLALVRAGALLCHLTELDWDKYRLHRAAFYGGHIDFALAVFPTFGGNRTQVLCCLKTLPSVITYLVRRQCWAVITEVYTLDVGPSRNLYMQVDRSVWVAYLAYGFLQGISNLYSKFDRPILYRALQVAGSITGFELLYNYRPELFLDSNRLKLSKAAKQADFPPLLEWLDAQHLVSFDDATVVYNFVRGGGANIQTWIYRKMRTWTEKPVWFKPFFNKTTLPKEFGDVL